MSRRRSRVETTMADDRSTSSSDSPPLQATTDADEPINTQNISQQSAADYGSINDDSGSLAPDNDMPPEETAQAAAGTTQSVPDDIDDGVEEADVSDLDSLIDTENKCDEGSMASTSVSGTEPSNSRDSVMQEEPEPSHRSTSPNQCAADTFTSAFPPLTIHPFDMPCPLQVGSKAKRGTTVTTDTTVAALKDDIVIKMESERSQPSEAILENETLQHQDYQTQQKLSALYPSLGGDDSTSLRSSRSSVKTDPNSKSSHFDVENQSHNTDDDSKEEKCWFPSSTLSSNVLIDEDDEVDDFALRPPELMRQDAASGLVWSVSQPGAFRQGGNGDDAEEEHDDWMMATRISDTLATVDDSHIIVHAAAVVDDSSGQQPQDQELEQEVSSFVVMGGEVEAVEVCSESQSPRSTSSRQADPRKPLRKVYAVFACIIFIAVTVTVFVTVEVVNSGSHGSKHQPSVDWPSFSPIGTFAPTSSDQLLIRSSTNNETFVPRPSSIISNPDGFVWKRLGGGLDGQFANETMGYSVSISAVGWILAVGSPWVNDMSQAGAVSVYHLGDYTNWTAVGNTIPGVTNGERFGWSVDISDSGDVVAASAPDSGAGRVTVYQYDARNLLWDKVGSDLVGEYDGQGFGYSVSLSGIGNIVATGAPGTGNDTGHVYVYQFSGSNWELMGSKIGGSFGGQRFGGSVSLSLDGQTLAVGTIEHLCNRHTPHVRVYHWNSTGWEIMGDPINGTSAFDQCAMSVALSADGTTVACGAYLSTNNESPPLVTGSVLVFRWNLDRWEQLGNTVLGETEYGNFGVSVAMSLDGNLLVAGANLSGKNGAGRVRVFHYNQTEYDWQQHGSTMKGGSFDELGKSVAISPGGRVVAGGAFMHSEPGLADSGQVQVYTSF